MSDNSSPLPVMMRPKAKSKNKRKTIMAASTFYLSNTDKMMETLSAFVPPPVLHRLDANNSEGDNIFYPTVDSHDTAILFADISGYTAITERFAKKGVQGAAKIREVLVSQQL